MNIKPKTIFTGDNLPILRGINSESVDLIYLDPPFNSNANYAAPIGSQAAGAEFKDTWSLSDIDIAWLDLIEVKYPAINRVIHAAMTDSDTSYLIYMATRLLEMHRILKADGSIYLHCDPTMSHYLKLLLDAIFGRKHFRNEIVWCYHSGGATKKHFPKKHEILLLYGKDAKQSYHNPLRGIPYRDIYAYDKDGSIEATKGYHPEGKMIPDWWEISVISSRANERTGYPTQKPLALLERVINTSSRKDGMVFDPFCGCATTCVAADRLQRNWIGIDISSKASELVVDRIKADQGLFQEIIHREDIPKRTDLGNIPRYNAPENKTELYGKQEGYCNGCGDHFQSRQLEVDHIIAKSAGGTDHISNLQLLCSYCNRVKGNRGQEYLLMKLNS